MARREPTADPRSARPSVPALKPSFCCTVGMSGTQLAKTAPWIKKTASTA